MKKIIEKLKEAWQYLNGKKTAIGMFLMLTAQGVQVFFPEAMTEEQISFLQTAGAAIGGFGLIHKAGKTKMFNPKK